MKEKNSTSKLVEKKQPTKKISPKQIEALFLASVIDEATKNKMISDLEAKNLLSGTRGNHSQLMKQFNKEFKIFSDKFFHKYNKGSNVFVDNAKIERMVSLAYKKAK